MKSRIKQFLAGLAYVSIHVLCFWLEYFPNNLRNIHSVQQVILCSLCMFNSKTIFSWFYKHWTWLHQTSLFSFEFLTTEPDWKFKLIQMFGYRKSFLGEVEIYFLINFILKFITFVYIAILVYFCMLIIN